MTKATTTTKTTQTAAVTVKDTGKVRVGGSSIRFASTRDTGKVHVGGSSMRF